MKFVLALAVSLLVLTATAWGRTYTFDPPTENTDGSDIEPLTEYRLHCAASEDGPDVGDYTTVPGNVTGGNVENDFPLLEGQDSWCGMTAVYIRDQGTPDEVTYESVESNVIFVSMVAPPKPTTTPNAPTSLTLHAE